MRRLNFHDVHRSLDAALVTYQLKPNRLAMFLQAHTAQILQARDHMRIAGNVSGDDAFVLYVPKEVFSPEDAKDMTFLGMPVYVAPVPTLIIGREVAL